MTVRLGIVGCGAAARRLHLPGFRAAGADLVAFASRTRASAEEAAAWWGSGEVADDWRALVAMPDLDGVVVCTPNALHAPVAIAAAEAGHNVLVEKPIAPSLADADAMIAAAERAGVILSVAHNARVPFAAMRDAVPRVGRVVAVRAWLTTPGPAAWAPGSDWFFDEDAAGGGALLDLGVHVADLVRATTGLEVATVAAITEPPGATIDDAAHVLLSFEGGATGSIHVAWNAPMPDHGLTIVGTDAVLHADARTAPSLLEPGRDPAPLSETPGVDPYAAFVRAIEAGGSPEVTGRDGRAALAIVRAAYDAASTGQTVKVS